MTPAGVTLACLSLYFLRLGALGFGGPVALADAMRRELVEERGWLSDTEYESGLAIGAACPGPLAYQLGVYCGYVRFGVAGALAVGLSFALAPFLIVVVVAAAYVRLAGGWPLRAVFYGVGPVVVALIVKACWNLGQKTLRRDAAAWICAAVACAVTVVAEEELTALFVAGGLLGAFLFAPAGARLAVPAPEEPRRRSGIALSLAAPLALGGGLSAQLFLFFFKTGCLVFGSGLVIVPFLKAYVVDQYHWLGNREFLDAVAVGMISPGPVVITATFVGYIVDGFSGAGAATVGIFTPAVLFTLAAAPILKRHGGNPRLKGFIRGVTVTVVGVLVGTTALVARTAIGDLVTAALAVLAVTVLAASQRVPEPALVLAGALLGLAAYPLVRPEWLLQ